METDWTFFGASAASIKRGATAGITPPRSQGTNLFTLGFHSQVTSVDAVGLYKNGANFAPLKDDLGAATGCVVEGVLYRGGTTLTGYSVGLFGCLQAATKTDVGYLLGLSDNSPHEIVLAKTTIGAGLDPTAVTVLRKSAATYQAGTWIHARLEVIVNPNGDVVLKVKQHDIETGYADDTSPTWASITGMADFIDDALGINAQATGYTTPLAGGYGGAFFQAEGNGRIGAMDRLRVARAK